MSAFIVSPECMTRCIHAIMAYADELAGISTLRVNDTPPFARLDEQGQKIGDLLYRINGDAILARYRERDELPVWKYEAATVKPDPYLSLKSLDCLQYQCAEGDIPEREPAYAELGRVICIVAKAIARNTPEYDRAPWD